MLQIKKTSTLVKKEHLIHRQYSALLNITNIYTFATLEQVVI